VVPIVSLSITDDGCVSHFIREHGCDTIESISHCSPLEYIQYSLPDNIPRHCRVADNRGKRYVWIRCRFLAG